MSFVLVKFESNWADEMDISGFVVVDKKYWTSIKTKIKAIEDSVTQMVGSNEEITFESGNELLESLTVKNLTDEEAQMYRKHFGPTYQDFVLTEFGYTKFMDI